MEVIPSNISIERISESDLPIVKSMLEELYLELGEEKESITYLTTQLIADLLSEGKTSILKATLDREIIGILTLTESQAIYSGGKFGSIDEMYVKPGFRSRSVGELLVKTASEIGKAKGWNRIDVTGPTDENPQTVNFYKRNGFVFTGPKLKRILA